MVSRYSYLGNQNLGYRYSFNGKENDADVKGDGNQIDYGKRVYDPRVGRFLSVDPLFKGYPWNSPYVYAENDVIRSIDLDGFEKYVVVNNYDKYGRITSIRVESVVTIGDGAPIDQDFKIRKTNTDLTDKSIYVQHLRNNQFIANDQSRNGSLTPRENLAYNTKIKSQNTSNSFDSDNGVVNGEDEAMGNEFNTSNKKIAYSYIAGSKEGITHNTKDGKRVFTNINAETGSGLINGTSYTAGTLTSAEGTGTVVGLGVSYAVEFIKGEISRQGKDFLNKKGLNIGFVESITITYANQTPLTDWKKIANKLGSEYGLKVSLKFDPAIQMKELKSTSPGNYGYGSVSVGYSGVVNGDVKFADKKAQIR